MRKGGQRNGGVVTGLAGWVQIPSPSMYSRQFAAGVWRDDCRGGPVFPSPITTLFEVCIILNMAVQACLKTSFY